MEKPLLIIEYEAPKVLWRLIFPNGLALLISYGILFGDGLNFHEDSAFKYWYIIFIFGFLAIGVILVTIEMFLMKEIRFYNNYMEKEWSLFGIKSLEYSNIKLRGITSWSVSSKGFLFIKKPKWYNYKYCGYDEHLISKDNKEKAIEILAEISNRNIDEFTKLRLEMNPLIKNSK